MNRQIQLPLIESARKKIEVQLEAESRRINEEIWNYPRPIAAWDLQFNYLLEERARLAGELRRLHEPFQKACETYPDRPAKD